MISDRDVVPDLVILGNATIDDLVFPDGSTRMEQPGGNALYSACGALLWGVRTGVCTIAGPDYPLPAIVSPLLDDRGIRRTADRSLRNWGLYEADGNAQYIFLKSCGPNPHEHYSPTPGDIPSTYFLAPYVHLAPVPEHRTLQLLATLQNAQQRQVSVDPDVRWCDKVSATVLDKLMSSLTFFLPSLREAVLLFPNRSPSEILRHVRDTWPSVRVAAIKMAGEGCVAYDRKLDTIRHFPAVPVSVMDTTGAGDAFCGGFLAGYALSGDGFTAVMHGLVSASFAVESYGLPRMDTLSPLQSKHRLTQYLEGVAGASLSQS